MYSSPCSESTVVVNTTHWILSKLQRHSPNLVTTMPTPRWENVFGYDTAFSSWKLFLLQYKRPYQETWGYKFYLNWDQNLKLLACALTSTTPSAFVPLVLVRSDQHLSSLNPQLLNYVTFVDVRDFWPLSTMFRVFGFSPPKIRLEYKIIYGPWMSLSKFYTWPQMEARLLSCEIGNPMATNGNPSETGRLLRELVNSFYYNRLPGFFQSKIDDLISKRFPERHSSQVLEKFNSILDHNRRLEKRTVIGTRSFRTFIVPT